MLISGRLPGDLDLCRALLAGDGLLLRAKRSVLSGLDQGRPSLYLSGRLSGLRDLRLSPGLRDLDLRNLDLTGLRLMDRRLKAGTGLRDRRRTARGLRLRDLFRTLVGGLRLCDLLRMTGSLRLPESTGLRLCDRLRSGILTAFAANAGTSREGRVFATAGCCLHAALRSSTESGAAIGSMTGTRSAKP